MLQLHLGQMQHLTLMQDTGAHRQRAQCGALACSGDWENERCSHALMYVAVCLQQCGLQATAGPGQRVAQRGGDSQQRIRRGPAAAL